MWEEDLLYLLAIGYEVDLADFDYATHGEFCENVARRFMVSANRDAKTKSVHFRQAKLENSHLANHLG
jgi:hypothetical protein